MQVIIGADDRVQESMTFLKDAFAGYGPARLNVVLKHDKSQLSFDDVKIGPLVDAFRDCGSLYSMATRCLELEGDFCASAYAAMYRGHGSTSFYDAFRGEVSEYDEDPVHFIDDDDRDV